MASPWQNHPFPVTAYFERSLVLTFAAPLEALRERVPECLELDGFAGRWGFVAVAMVDTRRLRPLGFPAVLGNDFVLIGYRIFVRHTNRAGRRLRGLYILRSETNKKRMELLGGLFTRYRYVTTDIAFEAGDDRLAVRAPSTGFAVVARTDSPDPALPTGSPFADWREARRFAGPLPFTFSYDARRREVLTVRGSRQAWTPRPVVVESWRIPYVEEMGISGTILANAFLVEQVPYRWDRGTAERWDR